MTQKKENGYKKFYLSFVRPQLLVIIFLLGLNLIGILFSLLSPLLTRSLIDDVFLGKRLELFGFVLLGIGGIYAVSAVSNYFASYLQGRLNLSLFGKITEECFNVLQFAPLEETLQMKTGDLLSRLTGNVRSAIQIFSSILPQLFISIIGIVAPLVIMLRLNVQLTLLVMPPLFLFAFFSVFFGKRIKSKQKKSLERSASLHSLLKEFLSALPLIKVFGLEKGSRKKMGEEIKGYYDSTLNVTKISSLSGSIDSLVYGLPMVLLFGAGGWMVIQGSLSLGTLIAFLGYVGAFFSPVGNLSRLWTSYKSSSAAFERIDEIFSLQPERTGNEMLVIKDGTIKLRNLCFSYGEKKLFKNLNATFERGINYIIGENGSGKTTLLKLLCDLYSPEKGEILLDGKDISKVKKESLRKNIAVVFSEPYLFDFSIYENIHLGNVGASKEEVIEVAKLVRMHYSVMSLPEGYDTKVGEAGVNLSSGEKQKIALARAILKGAPVILLDEVIKSIDQESKISIREAIKRIKDKKTIITVTHQMNEIVEGSNVVFLGKREPPEMEKVVFENS